ncbi:inactive hydroxysteroid dehydrogenase-like protein 1 isoform X1 [Erpetoichthys calabaricus]|uniref:Hydroxysteroid dehydrogenase like 1 n=1 Tax=Erpetoichthys calabaricus TaxID=27687 RepID=A0A8C4RHD9_ERPCA|nr:inactive hydroxysteroid dehydrogenase-like protein 1 isoform X1 [Erpetoichthys calabaricus]
MAAVDSFYLLYREIVRSCNCYVETLALVGAFYTASKAVGVARDCYNLVRLHFIPRFISRPNLVSQYGRWAVVLGGTEAIGKAYAAELAKRGLNIILIGQDRSKLEDTAKTIAETYGVETTIIEADFSQGKEVCKPIKQAVTSKEIGILVNDIGVSYERPHYFTELSEVRLWDIINRNITAASLMVHLVLPGMVERKKGAIVNISSGCCCKPTPKMAAYSASKAYLDHFSRALHYEYASKGIFIQSLVPFSIGTESSDCVGLMNISSWLAPSPRVYAQHAVSTLGISHRTTGYWPHSIQFCFAQYMPEWMWGYGSNILYKQYAIKEQAA